MSRYVVSDRNGRVFAMDSEWDILNSALKDTASSVLASLRRSYRENGHSSTNDLLLDDRLDVLLRSRVLVAHDVAVALSQAISILRRIESRLG
jgi:hypothetical protein